MNDRDDVSREVNLDLDRTRRIGLPEAIFSAGKSMAQLERILDEVKDAARPLLLTRLSAEQASTLSTRFALDYDDVSRTAYFQWTSAPAARRGTVAVVSAGSTDVPVAKEAVRTLAFHQLEPLQVYDVGVAGLHRYLARAEELRQVDVLIVCAGMDAALVSVIGGDVPGVVIAVPTSVGYGVATGGTSALHASLASCASGVVVVNIDNGYGGACAALRALRLAR
jgi:NCAIR mutase (PurE)-related protein